MGHLLAPGECVCGLILGLLHYFSDDEVLQNNLT